jgi:predicted esterase
MRLLSTVWLALLLVQSTGNAQESNLPQKVETSIGIYDIQSRDDIHKFSASEIQKLVQMENGRPQGRDTVPHPVLVYCFEERTFRYTGGKYQDTEIKYRLHTPKTIRKGRKYPLIIHLHGIGEAGSDNISSLVHLHSILPMMIGPEQEDFFMLVTQCPEETPSWDFRPTKDGTLDVLMAAMEHVLAENPIDTRRMTITGVSSGGWGVWELLLKHPDMFAGVVPAACSAPPQIQRLTGLTQTPIWSFTNKGDSQVNPQSIQNAMHVIYNSGGSMAFTECDAPGHNAWRPAMEDYNCFRWMLAQKRGSWFAPAPGVIVHKSNSLLYALALGILTLTIVVFLLRKWLIPPTTDYTLT